MFTYGLVTIHQTRPNVRIHMIAIVLLAKIGGNLRLN